MGCCSRMAPEVCVDVDEYAQLFRRMNPPRVVIDNDSCDSATVIKVDSVNRHGTLLEVVQVITDLNLIVKKGYISSDGTWFMDAFYVTDRNGEKVLDEHVISFVQKSLESDDCFFPSVKSSVGFVPSKGHTTIELTGTDRPGLLSEICAVLTNLSCNVVDAEVWTHNARAAAVVRVTGGVVEDPNKLSVIKKLLCNVMKVNNGSRAARTAVSEGVTHKQRRLHQMMFDDRDYDTACMQEEGSRPHIFVQDCTERDYTVVILRSRDRPKLLFDTVCTLTDMQYVVFHGTVCTDGCEAYQEYYIRHVDGHAIRSEAERQRVIQCLEAAIERRNSEGLELELRTEDRVGLLSDITRIFRENGLTIRRAEISTEGREAVDTFVLSETSGSAVEAKIIESIRMQIGRSTVLRVKQDPRRRAKSPESPGTAGFLFANLFRGYSFNNFRLIGSYT